MPLNKALELTSVHREHSQTDVDNLTAEFDLK